MRVCVWLTFTPLKWNFNIDTINPKGRKKKKKKKKARAEEVPRKDGNHGDMPPGGPHQRCSLTSHPFPSHLLLPATYTPQYLYHTSHHRVPATWIACPPFRFVWLWLLFGSQYPMKRCVWLVEFYFLFFR